jgi:hypothetical protein
MKELLKRDWFRICLGIMAGYLVLWLTEWVTIGVMLAVAPIIHYKYKILSKRTDEEQ